MDDTARGLWDERQRTLTNDPSYTDGACDDEKVEESLNGSASGRGPKRPRPRMHGAQPSNRAAWEAGRRSSGGRPSFNNVTAGAPSRSSLLAEAGMKSGRGMSDVVSNSTPTGGADVSQFMVGRRRMAQREFSSRRDSPVMVKLLQEIIDAQDN